MTPVASPRVAQRAYDCTTLVQLHRYPSFGQTLGGEKSWSNCWVAHATSLTRATGIAPSLLVAVKGLTCKGSSILGLGPGTL